MAQKRLPLLYSLLLLACLLSPSCAEVMRTDVAASGSNEPFHAVAAVSATPCGGLGEKCCRDRVCNDAGSTCIYRLANRRCTACGLKGLPPCKGETPCTGNRPYVQLPDLPFHARCAECPETSFWTYTPGPDASCVPRCGSPGLPGCPRCSIAVPYRYMDLLNGECRSCDINTNNYYRYSAPLYGVCFPCGTTDSDPCKTVGCPNIANPYVDPVTGFCASCDTANNKYTTGAKLSDATCVPRCSTVTSAAADNALAPFGVPVSVGYGQVLNFGAVELKTFSVTVNLPDTLKFTGILATWDGTAPGDIVYTSAERSTVGGETVETFDINLTTGNGDYLFYLFVTGGSGTGQIPIASGGDGFVYQNYYGEGWRTFFIDNSLVYQYSACVPL